MKVSLLLISFFASASGFVPRVAGPTFAVSSAPRWRMVANPATQRPDVTQAVADAVSAAKRHGAASPEARLAWETVEELSASDNSVAYQPTSESQCLTEEEVSSACLEYADKLDELKESIRTIAPKMRELHSMAGEMNAIKLKVQSSQPGPDSPQLREAVKRAQSVSQDKGASSPEAKVAWAEVEEIASSGLSNAMGSRLDEECLVESAMEACMALEELNRVLGLNRVKSEGVSNF